jgi:cell division protein ZapA
MGQHDQHKARIAELEQELANLQSAAQAAARDSDGIKAELTRLRAELVDAEQVESELRAGLAGLVEERDALQMELDEALSREAAVPQAHQHAIDGPFASVAAAGADANLAPALERFAELLENCADKLEGKVQAP